MMLCKNCPLSGSCPGIGHPRYCELVDPGHKDYNPDYIRILKRQKPPSLLSMAGAFVSAVVTHVADGGSKASEIVQSERKRVCFACPFHDHEKDACLGCRCGSNPVLSFVGLDLELKRSWES